MSLHIMKPRKALLHDNHLAFYGHEFGSEVDLRKGIERFLGRRQMEICSEVPLGEWLWHDLVRQMTRSAFCLFETVTRNPNVHIELGYALASNLRIALLIREKSGPDTEILQHLPSDLAGLVQVRYSDTGKIEEQLESCIPIHWFSVTERLEAILQRRTSLDYAYLRCLLRLPPTHEMNFSGLVSEAKFYTAESSNGSLVRFLRSYDELTEVQSTEADRKEASESPRSGPDEVAKIDHFRIRIHEPYREWLCKAVGELGKNDGA